MKNEIELEKKAVQYYLQTCTLIAFIFWEKYFLDEEEKWKDNDTLWQDFEKEQKVGEFYAIGGYQDGCWACSDQYWEISNMATAIKYNATKEQIYEWYWETIGAGEESKKHQNLEIFLKYGWIESKELTEEEKKELDEKIQKAKDEFLKNYL